MGRAIVVPNRSYPHPYTPEYSYADLGSYPAWQAPIEKNGFGKGVTNMNTEKNIKYYHVRKSSWREQGGTPWPLQPERL